MSSKLRKLCSAKFWQYLQINVIRDIARHHTAGSMALVCYFSKVSKVESLLDKPWQMLRSYEERKRSLLGPYEGESKMDSTKEGGKE